MEEQTFIPRERERQVVEVVRHFLLAVVTFNQKYRNYRQASLQFDDLAKLIDDRGQSILFNLKELSHALYRRNSSPSEKEQLFDLAIASIFHLAMKIREDAYQLEIYGPKYRALTQDEKSLRQESLVCQFQGILSRAEKSLKDGMEEIDFLIKDIFHPFKELLCEYRENGLLIRFFLEEKGLLQEAMGSDALEEIFQTLYGAEKAQPYRLAGESYFASAFYGKAWQLFSLALEKNPADESLHFKIYLSKGMEYFYAFDLFQALTFFEKCLSLTERIGLPENHRVMIRKVCQKIQEEFPGRRKNDQHRSLAKKACAVQAQLEKLPPTVLRDPPV